MQVITVLHETYKKIPGTQADSKFAFRAMAEHLLSPKIALDKISEWASLRSQFDILMGMINPTARTLRKAFVSTDQTPSARSDG